MFIILIISVILIIKVSPGLAQFDFVETSVRRLREEKNALNKIILFNFLTRKNSTYVTGTYAVTWWLLNEWLLPPPMHAARRRCQNRWTSSDYRMRSWYRQLPLRQLWAPLSKCTRAVPFTTSWRNQKRHTNNIIDINKNPSINFKTI